MNANGSVSLWLPSSTRFTYRLRIASGSLARRSRSCWLSVISLDEPGSPDMRGKLENRSELIFRHDQCNQWPQAGREHRVRQPHRNHANVRIQIAKRQHAVRHNRHQHGQKHPQHIAPGTIDNQPEQWTRDRRNNVHDRVDRVRVLGRKVKLAHKEHLPEGNERKDGHIVRHTDHGHHPEGHLKSADVRQLRYLSSRGRIVALQYACRPAIHPTEYERTDHRHYAGQCGEQKDNPGAHVALVAETLDVLVDRYHHEEVYRAADARKRQLQPKHHVQLLALKPQHGVTVLGHCERFRANAVKRKKEIQN
uniref:Uncharacterized protein n=1 Tax=Anopheles coluzzii TaxID=1518534 RepID=A0A8W7PIM3_ANOCL